METITQNKVATIMSVALTGFEGSLIEVETDIKAGLPSLQIVGMGNKAIDEARQRVRSAITNSLLEFPARKLTVNLAPAELPKDGTHLDLPIALSILIATGQLKQSEVAGAVFAGELALDGHTRPIRGAIVIAEAARAAGATHVYVPLQNVTQARLVTGITVTGIASLQSLFRHLRGFQRLKEASSDQVLSPGANPALGSHSTLTTQQQAQNEHPKITIDSIIGHDQAKRALAIAAAGRHNLLLSGPPGTGKTLLVKALASLLPPLGDEEIIEVTKLHSLSHSTTGNVFTTAPFRSPHHSVTLTALIGGGLRPAPGDISLAHKGVLFLDELPEYPRATLEALRQPLEDRTVSLSRLYGRITYPADILLAATMNPCPCGYHGDHAVTCKCTQYQIAQYQKRISGPLLDRIDLRMTISKIPSEHFFDANTLQEKQHTKVLKLVLTARKAQKVRYKRSNFYNAYASIGQAKSLFNTTPAARSLLKNATEKLNLSSRGSLRVLRVARTIADLDSAPKLDTSHIAEALQFRN